MKWTSKYFSHIMKKRQIDNKKIYKKNYIIINSFINFVIYY